MQNESAYIIISLTLVVILVLVGVYGVIGYKIYLRNNSAQLKAIIDDYKKMAIAHQEEQRISTEIMVDLIRHVEFFKTKNEIT
jgi:predicted negative regulator of RcsB-dependent stress response